MGQRPRWNVSASQGHTYPASCPHLSPMQWNKTASDCLLLCIAETHLPCVVPPTSPLCSPCGTRQQAIACCCAAGASNRAPVVWHQLTARLSTPSQAVVHGTKAQVECKCITGTHLPCILPPPLPYAVEQDSKRLLAAVHCRDTPTPCPSC